MARIGGRWYYGWVMVVTLAITELISYGVLLYSRTTFINPMSVELGWSRAQISGAYSLSALVEAGIGIALGYWLDRHGPRLSMTVGSLIGAGTLVLLSQVTRLEIFYLLWFILGVVSAMVFYNSAFWIIAAWFERKRRTALTLLTFIAGFSSLVFTPLTQALIDAIGWRSTYLLYAAMFLFITVPLHWLVVRRRPEDLGLAVDGQPGGEAIAHSHPHVTNAGAGEILRSRSFWLLTAAFTLNAVGLATILLHLVPYLTDLGYSASFAALVYGLIGLISLPGRLVITPLGSKISPVGIVAALFFFQAISMFALLNAEQTLWVYLGVAVFAAGYGAIAPARAPITAEFYGVAHYGKISAILMLVVSLVSAFAPVLAGGIRDATGSYDLALIGLGVFSAAAAILIILAAVTRRWIAAAPAPQTA